MNKAKNKQPQIFTVTQINTIVRNSLESALPPRITVSGEISDWKIHSSGHCYFGLKDTESILPCVMWSSEVRNVKFTPSNGMAVLCGGYIDVYVRGGKYQFYTQTITPAGIGSLQLAFEQLVRKLKAEGLFDERYKQAIPPYPMRIGIVTSPTGAAVADISDSIHARWPCARLFLFPVPVQGEGAAGKIAETLRQINRLNRSLRLDVVIVGRGGGSPEDLWAFNKEVLARAIFDSEIPVISAVGHETDITIADLVADARASTPTKAGVIAVPDHKEVNQHLLNMQKRLDMSMGNSIGIRTQRLETVCANALFRNPYWIVSQAAQAMDEKAGELARLTKGLIERLRQELAAKTASIGKIEPNRVIAAARERLIRLGHLADNSIRGVLAKKELQLTVAANRLEPMDPRSVLGRGYSITTNLRTGRIVRSGGDVQIDDTLSIELARQDVITTTVKSKGKRALPDE